MSLQTHDTVAGLLKSPEVQQGSLSLEHSVSRPGGKQTFSSSCLSVCAAAVAASAMSAAPAPPAPVKQRQLEPCNKDTSRAEMCEASVADRECASFLLFCNVDAASVGLRTEGLETPS